MYKRLILCFFIVFLSASSYSQQSFEDFRSEINEKAEQLSSYSYHEGDSFNPDSLGCAIGEKIVRYANINNFKDFNSEDFPSILTDTLLVNDEKFIC